jgi:hypothetical protein
MKKKYVVRFTFNTHIEAESDSEALVQASYDMKYGIPKAQKLELKVIAAIPIAETPAPTATEQPEIVDIVPPSVDDGTIPF